MTLLLDHLWQSSAVLAAIGLLTLFFRANGAHVRHALWTAASLKFLVPFALLSELGHDLSRLLEAPPVQPSVVQTAFAMSQPFSDGPVFVALPASNAYALPATVIWLAGIAAVAIFWLLRWLKLRAVLRAARPSDIAAPMPVKMSATLLEPGLVGIFRATLLLPDGIAEKLAMAELQSIIAHEACHLRRRDNLWAALHMLVEAIFWFWPPVWWLGMRLIAERERACDEAVLRAGNDPQTYAESILKVCKHYVSSPLACASGVSGADLKQRMEDIMKNSVIAHLNLPKKALLAASAAAVLALPLAAGVFTAPPALAQQTSATRNEIRQDFTLRVVDEAAAARSPRGAPGSDLVPVLNPGNGEPDRLWLKRQGQITGNILTDAHVGESKGKPVIMFHFTPEAGRLFGAMTTKNVGRRIALVVNGRVISAPRVVEPMLGGVGELSGGFDMNQARMLVAQMIGTPR
jgi:beta-lactamase regulating signal transducer with metallopeptidase domain